MGNNLTAPIFGSSIEEVTEIYKETPLAISMCLEFLGKCNNVNVDDLQYALDVSDDILSGDEILDNLDDEKQSFPQIEKSSSSKEQKENKTGFTVIPDIKLPIHIRKTLTKLKRYINDGKHFILQSLLDSTEHIQSRRERATTKPHVEDLLSRGLFTPKKSRKSLTAATNAKHPRKLISRSESVEFYEAEILSDHSPLTVAFTLIIEFLDELKEPMLSDVFCEQINERYASKDYKGINIQYSLLSKGRRLFMDKLIRCLCGFWNGNTHIITPHKLGNLFGPHLAQHQIFGFSHKRQNKAKYWETRTLIKSSKTIEILMILSCKKGSSIFDNVLAQSLSENMSSIQPPSNNNNEGIEYKKQACIYKNVIIFCCKKYMLQKRFHQWRRACRKDSSNQYNEGMENEIIRLKKKNSSMHKQYTLELENLKAQLISQSERDISIRQVLLNTHVRPSDAKMFASLRAHDAYIASLSDRQGNLRQAVKPVKAQHFSSSEQWLSDFMEPYNSAYGRRMRSN